MKAILKADRKVILDLDPRYGTKVSHGKDGSIKFETPAYVIGQRESITATGK